MKGIWALIQSIGKFIQGLGSFTIGALVLLVIGVIVTSMNTSQRPSVPNGAVLILWPDGAIVEQVEYPDPLETAFPQYSNREPQTSIHDITRALKRAKNDDRIAALAVITDSMGGAAPSHLHSIAASIRDFKENGKKVYALSTAYSQSDYLIAAEADKVFMNPGGNVLMAGYGAYPTYFKSMLDKIGATVNVFRVGTFKAAVEPFIRDDMSEAAKEANLQYLGSLWGQYTSSIETARGMEAGTVQNNIATIADQLRAADGDLGKLALNTGLVDELSPRKAWRQALIEEYGEDSSGTSFKQLHYQTYLAATDRPEPGAKHIAVITAQGPIVMGEGPVSVTAAETVVGYIREARNNPDTGAILLRVDSSGGSAFASELIRQELVAAQEQNIKVIASMGPVAASGGYWIAATADEIWAAPTTITGSIGIFGMVPTYENTLDKVGIHSDGVGTTPLAGAFSVARPMSDLTKDIIQQSIEAGYDQFINLVAEGRNMTPEAVDKVAQGRVWSGLDAKDHGLVDHLGDFDEAVKAAANAASLEDYAVVFYRDRPDEFAQMVANLLNSTVSSDTAAPKFGESLSPLMKQVLDLKSEADVLFNLNDPMSRYTVCFTCEVRR